ncbi:hypothetical protein UFOVP650_33 [uncultured Caudovirales phage]|uniref:Uncharacterized protein n=1 Tax=uncultured Caudovirales phage TaxID=2100421 RepID=A0A6J5NC64_9CAUD|nr:hypothetical protein UFOVP650_33 [uncultured Caudovirales phage]
MKCVICRKPAKGLMCPACSKSWDRWHSRKDSSDDGSMWTVIAWVAARVWKLAKVNERRQVERIRLLRQEIARLEKGKAAPRTAMDAAFELADLRCTKCGAKRGECGCWERQRMVTLVCPRCRRTKVVERAPEDDSDRIAIECPDCAEIGALDAGS